MPRIQLLAEEVASQVAAGEVVERPASVVKELVENALDAYARQIEILIRRGGISLIRVVDDGIGMDRDDALLCLERHATSKIRTGDDLATIRTLGFRGEALPSIASVSRFQLSTREREALVGTEIFVQGGRIESVRDGGAAPGTQVEVRSLFYNLPARRKFLRAETTEARHVEHQLQLQALGHPGVGFVFVQDEKTMYQLPPAVRLLDRIRDLNGSALAEDLLEVEDGVAAEMRISGYIGKPGISRSTRAQQLIFLNGRAIENSTINYALREGYHTALMKGQYPVTFLFVEMDPAEVDVNVHPAKREVRFRDPATIREAVVRAVRRTLERSRTTWSMAFQPGLPENLAAAATIPGRTGDLIPPREQIALRHDWAELPVRAGAAALAPPLAAPDLVPERAPAFSPASPSFPPPADGPTTEHPVPPEPSAPSEPVAGRDSPGKERPLGVPRAAAEGSKSFKVLGVLGKLYILMESAAGLVLVDQHAAHERILFEEMRRRMEAEGVPTQRLLLPVTIQVAPRDADWLSLNLAMLQRAGIGIEGFGAGTFKIDALPTFLRGEVSQLVREIIDDLRETSGSQTSKMRLGEEMIAKTVCRHAVKANDYLREPELVRLIQDLLACELPYCCPHGRPTMIQMSYLELEKKFGRKAG